VGDGDLGFEQTGRSERDERASCERRPGGLRRRGAVGEGSELRVGADEFPEVLARDQAPAVRRAHELAPPRCEDARKAARTDVLGQYLQITHGAPLEADDPMGRMRCQCANG
jgi:hypothetical protein